MVEEENAAYVKVVLDSEGKLLAFFDDTALAEQQQERAMNTIPGILSFAVGFTPLDIVKDTADLLAGKDVFTGEEMNRLVLALTIVTPEIGDKLIKAGAKRVDELVAFMKHGAKDTTNQVVQTGARELSIAEWMATEKEAKKIYGEIAQSTDDVAKIAENTGMSEWKIQRIKDHVFINEHILSDGVRKFDPDYDMAQAWRRLEAGTYSSSDIDLLNHELFESKFEGIFKTDYSTAHNATIKSGRDWKTNE